MGKVLIAGSFMGLIVSAVAPSSAALVAVPRQACQQSTFEQAQQFWVPSGTWSTVWYADTYPDALDCPVPTSGFDMTTLFTVWADFHVSATTPIYVTITRQSFSTTTVERKVLINANYGPGDYDVGLSASFPSASAWDYFDVGFYDTSGVHGGTAKTSFKGFGLSQ